MSSKRKDEPTFFRLLTSVFGPNLSEFIANMHSEYMMIVIFVILKTVACILFPIPMNLSNE
jgi:hypothetical protein